MADSPSDVLGFLEQLAERSLSMAKKDYADLSDFANEKGHERDLESWDVAYYSEKMREQRYQFSQEEVKPYFPVNLYGIKIAEIKDVDTWHKDVQFFEITDERGVQRGRFYIDLYARPHKRGGAWMDECVTRFKKANGLQTPVAYLTCNFTPPIGDDPSLLTHGEVETLFHEFGHGLHHMLTQVDYLSVSGIHGVEWDAVELPSQFMENWCWQPEAIALISGHYKTGEVLPDEMFKKMLAAKNFQSGMQMARQIEFSIFDFRLHLEYDKTKDSQIYDILAEVRVSHIFLLAVMRRVITVINGLKCCRVMPFRCLKKMVFLMKKRGVHFCIMFWKKAAVTMRWRYSPRLEAGSQALTRCYGIQAFRKKMVRR